MTSTTRAAATSPACDSTVALIAADEETQMRVASALRAAGVGIEVEVPGADELVASSGASIEWEAIIVAGGSSRVAHNATVRRLRQRAPEARILLVAPPDSRTGVRSALEAGADGVVFEPHLEARLAPTLDAILAGQLGVPREAWRQVHRPTLSRREKQVLSLVVMDLTNGEIAARLFLAESTVKSHLSSAFVKLGVRSRNDAVRMILDPAEQLGLGILKLKDPGVDRGDRAPGHVDSIRRDQE
jgi:DNA-binding NarL/FixJ family response regulator